MKPQRYILLWLALTGLSLASPSPFKPDSTPTANEWKFFNLMKESSKLELWNTHSSQGVALKHWSWQWRLGWVRQCKSIKSLSTICPAIMADALNDAALVVRAEGATILGKRNEGNHSDAAVLLLTKAFHDPRNWRNGKPLFIEERILEALYRVGGKKALESGRQLAAKNTHLKQYWQKLNKTPTPGPIASKLSPKTRM